jgi:hypothetical protein
MPFDFLCRPLRDPRSKEVKNLPFPVDAGNGHYKPFDEVYGTKTKDVCTATFVISILSSKLCL